MRHLILILLLCPCFICKGQTIQDKGSCSDNYRNIPELTLVEPLDSSHIIKSFKFGRGLEGVVLEIRPNGTFTQMLFSCDGREPIDSGHWSISKGKLKLTTLTFELIRFGNIYFLIPPVDREKFKKDFNNALKTAKKNSDNELSFSGKVLWAINDEYYMKVGQ